jgi:hypothetical protein
MADKAGVSPEKAEHDWDHAKKIVKKEYGFGPKNPRYYALVMGIVKKMLGIKKESVNFKDFLSIVESEDEKVKPEDPYWIGYSSYHRELHNKPHPKNPHPANSPEWKRWEMDYDMGRRDRTRERSE